MKNITLSALTLTTLLSLAAAPAAVAQSASERDAQTGGYFCNNVHTLNTDGMWRQVDGSFAIEISDLGERYSEMGTRRTYGYSVTSEAFGNLVLDEGQISSTGFSSVYAFYSEDETLYELEDMWDGDAYLKVFDPYGTNILDATCVAAS
ncbi:MAG: hypothetical protein ACFB9N_13735 [Geitlerinemataceae cyanobacterium]